MKNVPHYRFMVCKGMQTIALTTTQREAEAEAARVGGEVHELTPTRNPLDPAYSVKLGRGAFSAAYAKRDENDEQALRALRRANDRIFQIQDRQTGEKEYYTHDGYAVDRGTAGVETQTALPDHSPWDGTPGRIDAAKLILWMARQSLKGDKAALAYLPNLRPVRLDLSDKRPDLIFKMPVYEQWARGGSRIAKDAARAVRGSLSRDGAQGDLDYTTPTDNDPLDRAAATFARNMQKCYGPYAQKEIEPVVRALVAIHEICKHLPMTKYGADAHGGNFAVTKNGHLILLDVFFSEMEFEDVVELWKKLKLKIKTPKGAKGAKAAKAPKAPKAKPASVQFASVSKKAASKKVASVKAGTTTAAIQNDLKILAERLRKAYPGLEIEVSRFDFVASYPKSKEKVVGSYVVNGWATFLFDGEGHAVYNQMFGNNFASFLADLAKLVSRLREPSVMPSVAMKPASVKKATTQKPASAPARDVLAELDAYTTELAKQIQKLKKDANAKNIRQGYKGTGQQKFRRQLWVRFANGALIDLWLEDDRVQFGGVAKQGFDVHMRSQVPYNKRTPAEVYAEVRDVLNAGLGQQKPATAKPATKKPRAAKGPKKLQGKKLDAFVSSVYSKVFNGVAVMWDKIPVIYKEIRAEYERGADDAEGRRMAIEAAKSARVLYGEKD